jgi:isopenicillin N synthase-like dioxygenase
MNIPVIDWNSTNIVEETREAFTHVGGGRFYNIWSEEENAQIKQWFKVLAEWYKTAPIEDKQAFQVTKSDNQHGWIPHDEEKGGETTNPKRRGDHKEQLNISHLSTLPDIPEFLLEDLKKTVPLMQKKGEEVIAIFEKVLDVPEGTLVDVHNNCDDQQIRAAWYLGADEEIKNNQISCGEHKDRNGFTLLFSESPNKKLQVKCKDKVWNDIEYLDNSMVVNIGVIMEIWTANYLYAPYHRVLNDVDESFTTGYFMQPHGETIIEHIGPNAGEYNFRATVNAIRAELRKAHMRIKNKK